MHDDERDVVALIAQCSGQEFDTMHGSDEIEFGRCVCGEPPTLPEDMRPAWATYAGWGCIAWTENGNHRERAPTRGEVATVSLVFPFRGRVGDIVWSLFETPAAVWNGYADVPEALADLLVVGMRISDFRMVPPAMAGARAIAVAAVEVLETVTLDDLLRSARLEGRIHRNWAFYGSHITRAAFGDLRFMSCDAEGDLDAFAIWHERDGVATLLVTGGSGHHESFFAAGNRRLLAEDVPPLTGGTR